jgi:hypothetical protein
MDFISGFALMGVLAYGVILAPLLFLALALPYAVLRLTDAQNRHPDPQLGFRAAQHFFFSLGVLLALAGLSTIVVDIIQQVLEPPRGGMAAPPQFGQPPRPAPRPRSEIPNDAQRTGAALILSGVLFAGLHLVFLLPLSRERRPSPTRRVFLGCRFAVHGLVVLFSLTGLLVVLFQRSDPNRDAVLMDMRNAFIGILLVWLPSWAIHFMLLRLASVPPSPPRRRYEEDEEDDDWEPESD